MTAAATELSDPDLPDRRQSRVLRRALSRGNSLLGVASTFFNSSEGDGLANRLDGETIPESMSGFPSISEGLQTQQAGFGNDWVAVFRRLQEDGELHKDQLMKALELCGFERPNRLWAENVLYTVTRFATLGQDEFISFVKGYLTRQRLAYSEAFRAADLDSSGLVDRGELFLVLSDIGMEPLRHVLDEVSAEVGQSADGSLNLEQFEDLIELLRLRDGFSKSEYDVAAGAFTALETSKNGSGQGIDTSDFTGILSYLGITLGKQHVDEVLRDVDANGTGHLSFHDYMACLRKVRNRELNILKAAMREADPEGGGTVSVEQSRAVLLDLGYLAPDLAAFQEAVEACGMHADGFRLDYHSFWKVLMVFRNHEGLHRADITELKEVVSRYDKSASGWMSTLDLGKALRYLGHRVPFEVQQQAAKCVDIEDTCKLELWQLCKLIRMLRQRELDAALEVWRADLEDDEQELMALRAEEDILELLGPLGLMDSHSKASFRILPEEWAAALTPLSPGEVDVAIFMAVASRLAGEARKYFKQNGGFTAPEVEHLQACFRRYDADGSGDISNKELIILIEEIFPDIAADPSTRPQLMEIMREVDGDGSGSLDFQDFMNLMKQFRDLQDRERASKELQAINGTQFSAQEVAEFRELYMLGIDEERGEITLPGAVAMMKQITPFGDRVKAEFTVIFREAASRRSRRDSILDSLGFPEFLWLMRLLIEKNFANLQDRTRSFGTGSGS